MILLDTCVLFWLEQEPSAISAAVRDALAAPAAACFASSISALELGQKVSRNLLKLPLPTAAWLHEVCARRDIVEIPVDFEIAAASAALPLIHRDPYDRLLIATAMRHKLAIATPDTAIPRYPNLRTLW
jgi:PIN domain nuclease of toxin-antitoxin system